MTALQIDYRPPQALADHPRNARKHSKRQINQLKASIRSFSFNVPVILDHAGTILAGHGRVRAAIELSLPKIPTVTLNHMTPKAARAFMLADNQLGSLSTWDSEILADELQELALAEEAFEITDTGFELQRIDVLIEERHKPKADEDVADAPVDPANVEAVSRLGDLWLLGPHRLFVGPDSRWTRSLRCWATPDNPTSIERFWPQRLKRSLER